MTGRDKGHSTGSEAPDGKASRVEGPAGHVGAEAHAGADGGRSAAKARRREAILTQSKRLFAAQGFRAVSIEEIGAGAGVSGPAVYRHFGSKEDILVELLVGISEYLHDGGERIIAQDLPPEETLLALLDFHLDFALGEPELIRIQDRDFTALPSEASRRLRRLQRSYISAWARVLRAHDASLTEDSSMISVHAVVGMVNSTPYVTRRYPQEVVAGALRRSARAALGIGAVDEQG